MGKVIARLRRVYQTARAEATPQVEEVVGDSTAVSASSSEVDSMETLDTKG